MAAGEAPVGSANSLGVSLSAGGDSAGGGGHGAAFQRTIPGPGSPPPSPGGELHPMGMDDDAAVFSDRARLPQIEGYELLREVKHGGQGVVYLAIQRSTKRKVAIKVLLAGRYASKSARRRFEREIELVASLKHPNIIAVFDSGKTSDGSECYVMDYVRGMSVTAYVREKKPTLEETLGLFATVCDAVAHAHQRGVIHRDLKPSNVLVDVDGNARVLDFGLAKTLTDPVESYGSITGIVVGTLQYMSPEQTRGNPDEIDTRSDVYALGVILYEMLTGRLPYSTTGEVAQVIRNIAEAPPGRPSKSWSSDSGVLKRSRSGRYRRWRGGRCPLDFDVETVMLKALAKDREHRYETAGQFARDIRRYLNGEQITARRASAWYQLRVFARRNKGIVAATLAVLVALAAGVVGVTWQWRRAEGEKRTANVERGKAEGEKATAEVERGKAARAADALGNAMAFSGDYFAAQEDLLSARHLYSEALDQTTRQGRPGTPILMGLIEIANRPGGEVPLLGNYGRDGGVGGFRGHRRSANNVVVLRKTDTALTAGMDGRLILWDLVTGRALRTVEPPHTPTWLAYVAASRDETHAAVARSDGKVVLYQLPSLEPVGNPLEHPAGEEVWMVTLTDDLRVLTGTNKGTMTLWIEGTPHTYDEPEDGDKSVAGLAFLPDNPRYAVSGCGDGKVRLWDLQKRRPIKIYSEGHDAGKQVNCVAFSRDGMRLVTASFDGTIRVWDVRRWGEEITLELRPRFMSHDGQWVWRVAFSSDGSRVASASSDGTVRLWWADTAAELRVFKGQTAPVTGVDFWDDSTLASTSDVTRNQTPGVAASALKVWDLSDPGAGQASVPPGVKSISVEDDGQVSVDLGGGTVTFFAGEDGRLHDQRTTNGPAARPAVPAVYATAARLPRWDEGGQAGPAPAPSGSVVGRKEVPLSGGRGKLVGRADGKIELWGFAVGASAGDSGAATMVVLRTLQGHKGRVDAIAMSPSGRYIVSADALGEVRVWDVMRPARSLELERKLAEAYEHWSRNPASNFDVASLERWYSFCGAQRLLSKLSARVSGGAGN
jgi:WD40 repeat protein/tRNA A-37 threonylcarbamoyl transferase component Bud32